MSVPRVPDPNLILTDVQDKSVQRLPLVTASTGTTVTSRTRRNSKRTVSAVASLMGCEHDADSPLEIGFIEPKSEPGERSPQQLIKGTPLKRVRSGSQRKSTKDPSPEAPQRDIFPSTTPRPQRPIVPTLDCTGAVRKKGAEVAISSAPTSPVHRRTRSMSMVLTPPLPLDTTHSNVRGAYIRLPGTCR